MTLKPLLLVLCLLVGCRTIPVNEEPSELNITADGAPVEVQIGDVTEELLYSVKSQLDDTSHKALVLTIDSYGGSVEAGIQIIKYLEAYIAKNGTRVTCIVDHKAMSMGLVLLESGACQYRMATSRSLLLAHHASVQIRGGRTAQELRDLAEELEAVDAAILEMIARRMGMSYEDLLKKIDHKDWMFSAFEALALNAIDEIIYV